MKKILLLVFITILGLSSCKKDRTCKCVYYTTTTNTVNGSTNTTTSYQTVNVKKQTRKQAERGFCASYSWTNTSTSNITETEKECFLK